MIVYKVLHRNIAGRLYSFRHSFREKDASIVHYPLNELAKPKIKGTLLLAFKTLKDAKMFKDKRHHMSLCIYKAHARTVKPVWGIIGDSYLLSNSKEMQRLWKKLLKGEMGYNEENINVSPEGTVGCVSLRLIEEVAA